MLVALCFIEFLSGFVLTILYRDICSNGLISCWNNRKSPLEIYDHLSNLNLDLNLDLNYNFDLVNKKSSIVSFAKSYISYPNRSPLRTQAPEPSYTLTYQGSSNKDTSMKIAIYTKSSILPTSTQIETPYQIILEVVPESINFNLSAETSWIIEHLQQPTMTFTYTSSSAPILSPIPTTISLPTLTRIENIATSIGTSPMNVTMTMISSTNLPTHTPSADPPSLAGSLIDHLTNSSHKLQLQYALKSTWAKSQIILNTLQKSIITSLALLPIEARTILNVVMGIYTFKFIHFIFKQIVKMVYLTIIRKLTRGIIATLTSIINLLDNWIEDSSRQGQQETKPESVAQGQSEFGVETENEAELDSKSKARRGRESDSKIVNEPQALSVDSELDNVEETISFGNDTNSHDANCNSEKANIPYLTKGLDYPVYIESPIINPKDTTVYDCSPQDPLTLHPSIPIEEEIKSITFSNIYLPESLEEIESEPSNSIRSQKSTKNEKEDLSAEPSPSRSIIVDKS
ncbi:uncharacterized protein IL334_004012 [Kwoniella shivajii]|uniref:Uncharacterized protein n=1 Tax=Kwoniella shivajii TaxID=564305 RepID=A0ABZ1CZ49_9TREE|nr:hypothetical protein IL334_004012 [Kwoniella shivajii]